MPSEPTAPTSESTAPESTASAPEQKAPTLEQTPPASEQKLPTLEPKAPTLEEVARLAGVSRATVSRAINGGTRVSQHTRAAVELAITELGYTPNRAARSLVTRRTNSVALVVPETGGKFVSDPFLTGALQGVTAGLAGSDFQLVLLIAQEAGDSVRLLQYLRAGHVDGALVMSHHDEDHLPRELARIGLPTVLIGRALERNAADVAYVDSDNVGGARTATRYLVGRGARHIAAIAGPQDMPPGVDRLNGWREVLRASDLPDNAIAFGDFTASSGEAAMKTLLKTYPDVDAVFVANDLMASGALRVLREAGRAVPDDVAVVGFDDSVLAAATDPPLTTVRQNTEQLGHRMAELLLEQLRTGMPILGGEILPTELVVRASA